MMRESWLKDIGENTVNKTVKYNTGDYLNSPEEVAVYIESVLEEDDPALLLVALRNVADSQGGMAMMAEHSGLSRESLLISVLCLIQAMRQLKSHTWTNWSVGKQERVSRKNGWKRYVPNY